MVWYPPPAGGANGLVRNLTLAAGFGLAAAPPSGSQPVFQGANSIDVREPSVHWSGNKAIFSMVVGGPNAANDNTQFFWQLYEVTTDFTNTNAPVTITKVPNQPANYNNVSPCYGTDGRIIFVSDRPRNGAGYLYPQREEYLLLPTSTGLWSLDPGTGDLFQVEQSPSGSFRPAVDSVGRVVFTRWDHLSRDSEALEDSLGHTTNGTFNFSDETAGAAVLPLFDNYPEQRPSDPNRPANINGNAFNSFFPWQVNEDGTSQEILNHLGRHELFQQILPTFKDDPSLITMNAASRSPVPGSSPPVSRTNSIGNLIATIEDPANHGIFLAIDSIDLGTHAAGRIVSFNAPFGGNPDYTVIKYLTPSPAGLPIPVPANPTPTPLPQAIDIYRTPLPMTDGSLVAIHTPATITDSNQPQQAGGQPDPAFPKSRYTFRLKTLQFNSGSQLWTPATALTGAGFNANLTYYNGTTLVTYAGPLWELDPAEVILRNAPTKLTSSVASVEQAVFGASNVDLPTFQNYLKATGCALLVSRNVTTRDKADRQQPFNLQISWPLPNNGHTTTTGTADPPTVIAFLQFLQGDFLRGYTGTATAGAPAQPGRRVLPMPLHDATSENPTVANAPAGSVQLAPDGSMAAIVPARRALTWNLLGPQSNNFKSQVKERYWVSFQPGEIRTCTSCHGINSTDQAGNAAPVNPPQALSALLQFWKGNHPAGTLQLGSASYSFGKGNGTAVLSVTRASGSTGPLAVSYGTADGTALSGQDYAGATGTLNWTDGDATARTISIPLLNNPQIGGTKTFNVSLNGTNALVGAPASATVSLTEAPFESWLFQRYAQNANDPAVGGVNADPDGNGLSNLAEYAFNLKAVPWQAPLLRPPYSVVDPSDGLNYLTINYTRRLPPLDITYHVETSLDLGSWNEGPIYVREFLGTDDGNGLTQTAQARAVAPMGSGSRFLRVRVTKP